MSKYRLSSGLFTVNEELYFNSDKDAWEYLRKLLPNKYVTLYKQIEVDVPIVNRKHYIIEYNKKYKSQQIGDKNMYTYWIPTLAGVSSDEYDIKD